MAAKATKAPTAAARTISMFTGKTDLEDPNARDGRGPTREDREALFLRPRVKWKQLEGLRQFQAESINALIIVEREGMKKDGRWRYQVLRGGRKLGVFDSMCEAADAAEGT